MSRARRRDRRVYLRSHPVLFALLAAARPAGTLRIGRTVLAHDTSAYLDGLTRVPLDRAGAGTTGGAARELIGGGVLFDQQGAAHRDARRDVGLGSGGVQRLRPIWLSVLRRHVALLGQSTVDVVALARELAGATTAALLNLPVDPMALADAAHEAAAAAARDHLPGPRRPGSARRARAAADQLLDLVRGDDRAAMLAVAAVNTTVAGLPRAVAWCADDELWQSALSDVDRPVLVDELLRVVAPSPLLPRVAAGDGRVGDRDVRRGDRLLLVARHAVEAHRRGPDVRDPAPARVSQLVFGAGAHACPGARLTRAQFADTLAALAPYRPVVVRARVDRRSALPAWARLEVALPRTRSRDDQGVGVSSRPSGWRPSLDHAADSARSA
jgi:cytochrome P450